MFDRGLTSHARSAPLTTSLVAGETAGQLQTGCPRVSGAS